MAEERVSLPEVAPVPVIAIFPRRLDLGQIIRTKEGEFRGGMITVTNVGGETAEVRAEVVSEGAPVWLRCDPSGSFLLEPQEQREVFVYPEGVGATGIEGLTAKVGFSCNGGAEYDLPAPEVTVAALVVEPARLEWVDGSEQGLDFGSPVQGEVCEKTIVVRRIPGNNLPTVISEFGVCDDEGKLRQSPPWLEISEPKPRGMDLLIKVTLHTANLPVGPIREVIEFREDDPAVESLKLEVRANVQPAPDIEVTPPSVKIQGKSGERVEVSVELRNTGIGSLPVKITTSDSWISVAEDHDHLEIGSEPILVKLLITVAPKGNVSRGMVMVTPVSQPRLLAVTIPIEAEVLTPKLRIDNQAIHGRNGKSRRWEVPLENVGNADLTLEVYDSPPWLRVSPRGVLTVGPGGKAALVISDRRRSKDDPSSCVLKLKTNQGGNEIVTIPLALPPVSERHFANWTGRLLFVAVLVAAVIGFQSLQRRTPPALTETQQERSPQNKQSSPQAKAAQHVRGRDVAALLAQGLMLKKKGQLNEAAQKLRAVLQLDDTSVSAHYYLAWTYVALKQKQMAIKHFRRVVELSTDPAGTEAVEARKALARLARQ